MYCWCSAAGNALYQIYPLEYLLQPAQAEVVLGQLSMYLASWVGHWEEGIYGALTNRKSVIGLLGTFMQYSTLNIAKSRSWLGLSATDQLTNKDAEVRSH